MLEKALAARELLFRNYPQSPLVPACQLANAEGYEAIGDFEHAADAYELYVNGFEKQLGPAAEDERRGTARRRPSRPRPRRPTSRRRRARSGRSPRRRSPSSTPASTARGWASSATRSRTASGTSSSGRRRRTRRRWRCPIADLHERMNQYGKAVAFLDQRARDQERDPNKFLAAQARMLLHRGPEAEEPPGGGPPAEAGARLLRQALPEAEGRARARGEGGGGPRPVREERGAVPVVRPAEAPLGQGRRSGEGLPRQHQGEGPLPRRDQPRLHQRGGAGRGRARPSARSGRSAWPTRTWRIPWPTRRCSARSRPRPRRS